MAVASSAHTAPRHGRRRDGLGPLAQSGWIDGLGRKGGREGREDADDGVSDAKGGGGGGGGGGRDIATFFCFEGGGREGQLRL